MSYDPHCCVIKLRTGRWHFRQVFLGLVLVGIIALTVSKAGGSGIERYWFMLILACPVFWHFIKGMRRAGGDDYVLINRKGVFICRSSSREKALPWSMIHRAKRSRISGDLVVTGPNRRMAFRLPLVEVGDTATVDKIADEINRLIKAYAPE